MINSQPFRSCYKSAIFAAMRLTSLSTLLLSCELPFHRKRDELERRNLGTLVGHVRAAWVAKPSLPGIWTSIV